MVRIDRHVVVGFADRLENGQAKRYEALPVGATFGRAHRGLGLVNMKRLEERILPTPDWVRAKLSVFASQTSWATHVLRAQNGEASQINGLTSLNSVASAGRANFQKPASLPRRAFRFPASRLGLRAGACLRR